MKHNYRLFLLAAVAILLAAPFAAGQESEMMQPAERNVSYPGPDGVTLRGYMATPEGSGPYPAVIMIHEWWGLNKDIARLADALAQEGFVVLAPDLFRGSVAQSASAAMQQVQSTPRDQLQADLDAAVETLRDHPLVNSDRIASMGFCFGGTQSMYLGTRNTELDAVITFYGSGPITDPSALGAMTQNGPVLGVFGEEDGNIPVSEVHAFRSALEERGIQHTVTIYPEVGHAFVNSNNYDGDGPAGRAWRQLVAFLDKNL